MGNKKSVNKILLNELVNFDLNTLDMDTLGESLLWLMPSIEDLVDTINSQVTKMANIRYMPYVSAEEQCNYVIESICVKNDLVNVHNVFKYWYARISEKNRELLRAYFTAKNNSIYYRKNKCIIPLIRAFVTYLRIMLDGHERELIKNPYIYDIYIETLAYNQAMSDKKSYVKNKGVRHDRITNAKRDS